MKFQQIELTRNIPRPFFNPLTNFLEDCGKHFLNKNISFFVYSSMNGTNAYTYPQTSNFYLNTVGDISLSFRAFMDRHRSLNPDAFDCSSDQDLAAIMAFLEVLAHECTHMDEPRKDPRGCQGTHDQVFRDKMSELLAKFFITSGQRQTVLEKLKGHLCAGHLGRDENAISAS